MDWLWRGIRHCYFKMHCGSRTNVSNLKFKGKTTRYLLVLQVVMGNTAYPSLSSKVKFLRWLDRPLHGSTKSHFWEMIQQKWHRYWFLIILYEFFAYIYIFFTEIGNLTSFLLRTEYLRAKKLLSINAQYNYLLIEKFKIWIDCN